MSHATLLYQMFEKGGNVFQMMAIMNLILRYLWIVFMIKFCVILQTIHSVVRITSHVWFEGPGVSDTISD